MIAASTLAKSEACVRWLLPQVLQGIPEVAPAALSGLSRLQLCHLDTAYKAFALPSGPWLRSWRWISAGFAALISSTEALHEAAELECVSIAHTSEVTVDWQSPAPAAFFDWLAHHPPLRRLCLDWSDVYDSDIVVQKDFLLLLGQLWRRRPSLIVDCPGSKTEDQSFTPYLDAHFPF